MNGDSGASTDQDCGTVNELFAVPPDIVNHFPTRPLRVEQAWQAHAHINTLVRNGCPIMKQECNIIPQDPHMGLDFTGLSAWDDGRTHTLKSQVNYRRR